MIFAHFCGAHVLVVANPRYAAWLLKKAKLGGDSKRSL